MAKRKKTAFQKCVGAKLRGKKGGKAAFKKAVKACAKGRAYPKAKHLKGRKKKCGCG